MPKYKITMQSSVVIDHNWDTDQVTEQFKHQLLEIDKHEGTESTLLSVEQLVEQEAAAVEEVTNE